MAARACAIRTASISSAAKARAAPSASRRACACGDSPARAGPWTSTPIPSIATNGSTCTSRASAAACAAAAIATAAPDPRVARRLRSRPARRRQQHPRLALSSLHDLARVDDGGLPGDGRAIDLGANRLGPVHRSGRVPRRGHPHGQRHPRLIIRRARSVSGERPPRGALRGVTRVRSALRQRAPELGGRRAVRDLHCELLPGEGGGRGDARRRVGGEITSG